MPNSNTNCIPSHNNCDNVSEFTLLIIYNINWMSNHPMTVFYKSGAFLVHCNILTDQLQCHQVEFKLIGGFVEATGDYVSLTELNCFI